MTVSALSGTVLGEYAPLYKALSERGYDMYQTDRMEVWYTAVVLGHGDQPAPRTVPAEVEALADRYLPPATVSDA
ncbi:MAG TPA: hypothetical protein VGB14_16295 [Acidimicrobiales bacterium]